MATQVTMPMLGLTMEEGTVAEWLKQEGDPVAKDEPLLTVEMDKGTMEVPSPAAGVLRRIVVQPGMTVPVKALIAEIGEPGEVFGAGAAPAPATGGDAEGSRSAAGMPLGRPSVAGGPGDLPPVEATPRELAAASVAPTGPGGRTTGAPAGPGGTTSGAWVGTGGPAQSAAGRLFISPRARLRARALGLDLREIRGSGPHGRIVEADVLSQARQPGADGERALATPLARRLAQEHGLDISAVQGTGPGGRITQDDVLRAAAQRAVSNEPQPAPPRAVPDEHQPATQGAIADERQSDADVRPLSRIRRITAERMAASAQASARVTLFLDANFSEAARFRQQLQPEFARLGVTKLPWDALLAKAAALALGDYPAIGAQWLEGQGLRSAGAVHVGVAVALEPEGLVVPVLKDAGTRSLRELSADLLVLVDRARAGRLGSADMQHGTLTITNLGAYRIDGFTPILNPPESAILGVGRIANKPVVVDGQIVAQTMCTLSLSFDHRVVDGVPAAAFLARLAELVERPYALLGI